MDYKVFSGFQRGYAHVKNDTACEDYAVAYREPDGKFLICAVSDGHSDPNCFRSEKGARFGCEAAVEILTRFFTLYHAQHEKYHEVGSEAEERLKRSIKQCWADKVSADLEDHAITPEELELLSDYVRGLYETGRGLQNIYGATLLAAGMSEQLFIALQVGDGFMLCIDEDGVYDVPLSEDAKSGTGSPASLCDNDLFTRKNAFRGLFSDKVPQAVFVSSDGIGDSMDEMQCRELLRTLLEKLNAMEEEESGEASLSDRQTGYLKSCLAYWAGKGNGAEDDCSFAGIYRYGTEVPKVKIPLETAENMRQDLVCARNRMVQDYESRKSVILKSLEKSRLDKTGKKEELKQILCSMEQNEQEKLSYYHNRIAVCEEYVKRAGGNALDEDAEMPVMTKIDVDGIFQEAIKNDGEMIEEKKVEKEKVEEENERTEIERCGIGTIEAGAVGERKAGDFKETAKGAGGVS